MHSSHSPARQIRAESDGPVGFLLIDRPERRNALSLAMWEAIPGLLAELLARKVRVIVIRGAGDLPFCAGADISEFETVRASSEGARRYEEGNVRTFNAIGACPVPTIAMIRSFCIGGGLGLAAACDLRIASVDAEFGIPPGRLGLAYPPQALRYIVAAIGAPAAKDIAFTARRVKAEEAARIGLINRLVENAKLETETQELAATIADNAPLSLRAAKLAIDRVSGHSHADDASVEQAAERCFDSADYREGRTAFLEKRRPVFRGE